jgi:hypothetical protein
MQDRAKRKKLFIVCSIFLAGFIVALALSILQAPRYASGKEIEEARKTIAAQYINESSVACTDTSDPISPTGRIVVFYKYLRVNRYADRAVIRGCDNIDSLLAKTREGKWVRTQVNMALDARVNIRWQNACDIADITVADDVERPENMSIDEENYQECLQIRKL